MPRLLLSNQITLRMWFSCIYILLPLLSHQRRLWISLQPSHFVLDSSFSFIFLRMRKSLAFYSLQFTLHLQPMFLFPFFLTLRCSLPFPDDVFPLHHDLDTHSYTTQIHSRDTWQGGSRFLSISRPLRSRNVYITTELSGRIRIPPVHLKENARTSRRTTRGVSCLKSISCSRTHVSFPTDLFLACYVI